jgi:hypothetical protein
MTGCTGVRLPHAAHARQQSALAAAPCHPLSRVAVARAGAAPQPCSKQSAAKPPTTRAAVPVEPSVDDLRVPQRVQHRRVLLLRQVADGCRRDLDVARLRRARGLEDRRLADDHGVRADRQAVLGQGAGVDAGQFCRIDQRDARPVVEDEQRRTQPHNVALDPDRRGRRGGQGPGLAHEDLDARRRLTAVVAGVAAAHRPSAARRARRWDSRGRHTGQAEISLLPRRQGKYMPGRSGQVVCWRRRDWLAPCSCLGPFLTCRQGPRRWLTQ